MKKIANGSDASKGKATNDDHAGIANPHYILFNDYYGDVYAKYVGPYDGKTLVANKRGPIENGYLNPRFDLM
jgi:hypothetical protein